MKKKMTAKKQYSILEVVYWYNVIPKADTSPLAASAYEIQEYKVWQKYIYFIQCKDEV